MNKKGKFKLTSYVIEDDLIFFKSRNKIRKIVAFGILRTTIQNYSTKIQDILNKFLSQRSINFYTIQINPNKKDNILVILNLVDVFKDEIIRTFHKIIQNIQEIHDIQIIKKSNLEAEFINIIQVNPIQFMREYQRIASKKENCIWLKKKIKKKSLEADTSEDIKILIYFLDLEKITNATNFISVFSGLVRDMNLPSHLFFNIALNEMGNLTISPYFSEICYESNEKDILKEINLFFQGQLIQKVKSSGDLLFKYLWRITPINRTFNFDKYSDLFLLDSEDSIDYDDFSKLKEQIEFNLQENLIQFSRINENIYLINDSLLFCICSNSLDKEILSEYYGKKFIYILILNDDLYAKIVEMEDFNEVENVKILNKNEFQDFDFEMLKAF